MSSHYNNNNGSGSGNYRGGHSRGGGGGRGAGASAENRVGRGGSGGGEWRGRGGRGGGHDGYQGRGGGTDAGLHTQHRHNRQTMNAAETHNPAAVDYAFDSLHDLFQRSKQVLGTNVIFPINLDWYKLVHLNEKGDFGQLAAVWTECHQPWTFARMKQIKEAEEARKAGVAAPLTSTTSAFSHRERTEYAMSTANTNYSGGVGNHHTGGYDAATVQKEQQEQLSKFLQAMTRENPILKLCAEVVVGGTVTSFMAPMCSPLTKASCRYLTSGREGAGVEATDDERVSLAKTMKRHGLLRTLSSSSSDKSQPIYRSSASAHISANNGSGADSSIAALASVLGIDPSDAAAGGDNDGENEEAMVDDVDVTGGHGGPRKYWVTEKSDGLRVVLCSQLAHNFPRWTFREATPHNNQGDDAKGSAHSWLHHLRLPSLYPAQNSPIGASLLDTVVLESARASVSAVWTRVVNALVKIVINHAQKTICDDEERSKLLDNAAIGYAVLTAISTSLSEAMGQQQPLRAAANDEDSADLALPFEPPTNDVIYNGVRNIPGVTSTDVEGGTFTTMLFAESDQIKFASSGSFVLRIPIPLGFFIKHLVAALKEALKAKIQEVSRLKAASADGNVPTSGLPQHQRAPQQLTPLFILTAKTSAGDGGSLIMHRQLGQRHFTYMFDRSMSQIYCLHEEYPFKVNTVIMDAELIVAVPPLMPADKNVQLTESGLELPPSSALVPTLSVLSLAHHDAKKQQALPAHISPFRKAFFAIFDLFAIGKDAPHHPIYNNSHPTGRFAAFRLPIMRAHDMRLLNRNSMKERWELIESECVGPMNATAVMIQNHMVEGYKRLVAESQAKAAVAATATPSYGEEGNAPATPAQVVLPSPPQLITLTMFRKEMWPLEALPVCLSHIRKTRILTGIAMKKTYTTIVVDETTGATEERENLSEEVVYDDYYIFRGKTLNDGLIFTPDDFDIVAGSRKHQLKWKWPDRLSVDWKIASLPNKIIPLPTPREGELATSPEYLRRVERVKEIQSFEYFKVDMFFRRKKKPVDLAGDSEYRRSMRLLNPKRIYIPDSGCVAECTFNAKEGLWQIEKVRKDKYDSNAVITIISVMASACEGLDVSTLLATLGFLPNERAHMLISQYLRLTAGSGGADNDSGGNTIAKLPIGSHQNKVASSYGVKASEEALAAAEEDREREEEESRRFVDAAIARAAEVEQKILPEYSTFVAQSGLGLVRVVDGSEEPDERVDEGELDEEEKMSLKHKREMLALSSQLPMVHLMRSERAEIAEKEKAAIAAYREAVESKAAIAATAAEEAFEFHALDDDVAVNGGGGNSTARKRRIPSYTAPIPRCYMAVSLSSRGGGGQAAKALFLQWHAKIAMQRNSIPCNHAMVSECYGLGEECPHLRSGSRLEGRILIEMANNGGCYAWTDTVAEVVFDPLAGRWGIASVDTNGNKNMCYGTQVIGHLQAIATAQSQGKKFLVPKALRNLTARPPLGVSNPIDALNPPTEQQDSATAHNESEDDAITSSVSNAAHYALRTAELRDNDETSRVRRFNNWVKAVLMAHAASLVRNELAMYDSDALQSSIPNRSGVKDSASLVANAASAPISVAELCCGRGGDLHKWRQLIPGGYLLMIDHCFEAVAEAARRYSAGKGLSTKVVEGKDGFPGIPAHFAVKSCFSAEILPIVDHCKATAPKPQLIAKGFHIVSCQFSMHYAFQTERQVRNFLSNVSKSLRVGGLFIGTTCDATEILSRKARHGPTFGNDHYTISFDVRDSEIASSVDTANKMSSDDGSDALDTKNSSPIGSNATVASCYGTPYRFSLEASVVSEVEYLVDWDRFTDMASRDYGLVCLESCNFKAFRDRQRRTENGKKLWEEFLGDDALRRRGLKSVRGVAAETGGAGETAEDNARLLGTAPADAVLTPDEESAVSLYRTFVFQKAK